MRVGTVTQTGVITRADVLRAQSAPSMGADQARFLVGGDFFSNIRNFLGRAAGSARHALMPYMGAGFGGSSGGMSGGGSAPGNTEDTDMMSSFSVPDNEQPSQDYAGHREEHSQSFDEEDDQSMNFAPRGQANQKRQRVEYQDPRGGPGPTMRGGGQVNEEEVSARFRKAQEMQQPQRPMRGQQMPHQQQQQQQQHQQSGTERWEEEEEGDCGPPQRISRRRAGEPSRAHNSVNGAPSVGDGRTSDDLGETRRGAVFRW